MDAKDYQVIPYRDNDGYIIQGRKALPYTDGRNLSGGYVKASLVWCPVTNGLRWIGHCPGCKEFAGYAKFKGVRCKNKGQAQGGKPYLDRTKTYK